jgi:hypothetical protein
MMGSIDPSFFVFVFCIIKMVSIVVRPNINTIY